MYLCVCALQLKAVFSARCSYFTLLSTLGPGREQTHTPALRGRTTSLVRPRRRPTRKPKWPVQKQRSSKMRTSHRILDEAVLGPSSAVQAEAYVIIKALRFIQLSRYLLRDGRDVHPEPLRPFLQLLDVYLQGQQNNTLSCLQ